MLISVIDDCDPNPCENGGICTDRINTFTCDCEEDFTGLRCEQSKHRFFHTAGLSSTVY